MAKKLSDIEKEVVDSTESFIRYLDKAVDKDTMSILHAINQETDLLIFSGIIRNFFLGISTNRDLDITLEKKIDVIKYFRGWEIKYNSYGGYKLFNGSLDIDLWFIEDSWAFNHYQKQLGFQLDRKIPDTVFFNFSAVAFSFRQKKFYFTKHFVRFLRDKKIDIVSKDNANNMLCVVNTLYYSDKYKLKISENLFEYIRDLFKDYPGSYDDVQKKHFGKVLYSKYDIKIRLEKPKFKIVKTRAKKF
ncbi:hypothetical protein [Olivibacter domesticus]|uniref:Poly A polymerase head domain-containing protein n=1 Tax=Olivibacter domesticus TaxID=407022 RepID=A0A1H7GUQ3_OLID1|nr:hypothetical protein [Olivibacter domesticus]SEK39605.1 hypothetical protein SAMN05661044_00141 [Olivibacter domesticus]